MSYLVGKTMVMVEVLSMMVEGTLTNEKNGKKYRLHLMNEDKRESNRIMLLPYRERKR
jgi:hypothetical protein